jgi:hypothetical protein
MARKRTAPAAPPADAERILTSEEASLLDIVDNVLNKGVVLSGDLTIALANVDLVYARLSLLLCAADRVLPTEDTDFMTRHHRRHELRIVRARQRAAAVTRAMTPTAPGSPIPGSDIHGPRSRPARSGSRVPGGGAPKRQK